MELGECNKTYIDKGINACNAVNNIIIGSTRQFNQSWINYLSQAERDSIINAVKKDDNGNIIRNQDG